MLLLLITAGTFVGIMAIVFGVFYATTAQSQVAVRLQGIAAEANPVIETRQVAQGPGLAKRLLFAVGRQSLSGSGDASLTQMLSMAGYRGRNAVFIFLGVRTLLSFGPPLFIVVPRVTAGQPLGQTLYMAGGAWIAGHVMTNMWLKRTGRKRAQKIMQGLPDALDLMIVCLEAGLGLNATIARVGEERSTMDDPLGKEFSQVSAELREGRSREDALRTLGERNGVDELKSLAGLMIQSDKLGASMGKTLRSHSDLVRTKRRQRAEEIARKLPVKMLIPLALFILPPLLVVAAGPALLGLQELTKILGTG